MVETGSNNKARIKIGLRNIKYTRLSCRGRDAEGAGSGNLFKSKVLK